MRALSPDVPERSALLALLRLGNAEMISTVANAVEAFARRNDDNGRGALTRFHARTKPTIALKDYLDRLVTFAPFSSDVLILSVYYLHRLASQSSLAPSTLAQKEGPLPGDFRSMGSPGVSARSRRPCLNSFTVHRLTLGALVIAAKFLSDSYIPHPRACRVGGIGPAELAGLEVELLLQLRFELLWPPGALEALAAELLGGRFAPKPSLIDDLPLPDLTVPSGGADAGYRSGDSSPSTPESEAPSLGSGGAGPTTPESSAPSTPPPASSSSVTPKLARARLASYVQTQPALAIDDR